MQTQSLELFPAEAAIAAHQPSAAQNLPPSCAMRRHPLFGEIWVVCTSRGIEAVQLGGVDFGGSVNMSNPDADAGGMAAKRSPTVLRALFEVLRRLDYPTAPLTQPLAPQGSVFAQRVWQQLQEIPSGETRSYRALAEGLGQPTACRAVARACAANPIAVLIPCHRVVRLDGSLGGYRWGVERKRALLAAEAAPFTGRWGEGVKLPRQFYREPRRALR